MTRCDWLLLCAAVHVHTCPSAITLPDPWPLRCHAVRPINLPGWVVCHVLTGRSLLTLHLASAVRALPVILPSPHAYPLSLITPNKPAVTTRAHLQTSSFALSSKQFTHHKTWTFLSQQVLSELWPGGWRMWDIEPWCWCGKCGIESANEFLQPLGLMCHWSGVGIIIIMSFEHMNDWTVFTHGTFRIFFSFIEAKIIVS